MSLFAGTRKKPNAPEIKDRMRRAANNSPVEKGAQLVGQRGGVPANEKTTRDLLNEIHPSAIGAA
jgi:hypothetical protein